MLSDRELERLVQPIVDLYNDMELDLIREVASRFDTYETIGGTLEWQLRQLEKMGVLNADCVKVIAKYSARTEQEINDMLRKASMANFSPQEMALAKEEGLIKVTYEQALKSPELARVIQYSFIDTRKAIRLINTKCLESTNQAYMNVINQAYVESASGVRSYSEAITRALKQMAQRGITGATYKRKDKYGNEKIVNYSIEGVIRRDVVTGVNSLANKASIEYAEDIGYQYVEVSQHLGARTGNGGQNYTNHAWWQGKVYKLEGSEPGYPNLVDVTGYGDIQGLGGVNCRHRTFPFIPGVSKPQKQINLAENAKRYNAEQGLRKMERKMRELRRQYVAMKASGNKNEAKRVKQAILSYSDKIDKYCAQNGLKRRENREVVYG